MVLSKWDIRHTVFDKSEGNKQEFAAWKGVDQKCLKAMGTLAQGKKENSVHVFVHACI